MKNFIFVIIIFGLLVSCGSKKGEGDNADSLAVDSTLMSSTVATSNVQVDLKWEFLTEEDDEGTPKTKITLLINGNKNLLTSEAEGGFEEIAKNNYSQENIPETALIACKGFWAGLLHVVYVEQQGNTLVVKQGFLDEGVEEMAFEELKKIPL